MIVRNFNDDGKQVKKKNKKMKIFIGLFLLAYYNGKNYISLLKNREINIFWDK